MAKSGDHMAGTKRPFGFGKKKGHTGRALLLGGLLLFGTIFGAATLVLRSGTLWPGGYEQGTFLFSDAYLNGGSQNQLVVITANRQNEPLPNEHVTISMSNSSGTYELFSGRTNDNGIVEASVLIPPQPERGNGYSKVTLTVKAAGETVDKTLDVYNQPAYTDPFGTGSSSKVVPPDGTPSPVPPSIPPRLYLTMDKPRYQPGQTMHLRTLSFRQGAAVTDDVTYEISDPNGNKLFCKTLKADKFGITFLDYPISDILALGEYKISANTTSNLAMKNVPIEKYVLPKFGITFKDLRSWYTLDDDITASLNVSYFFGKPVDGKANITARLHSQEYAWYRSESSSLDRIVYQEAVDVTGGRASFTIPPLKQYAGASYYYWQQYTVDVGAEVTDSAGHTEKKNATTVISTNPFYFTAIMETPTPGQPYTATVVVRDPMGVPLKNAHVGAIDPNGKSMGTSQTNERGLASITFNYDFQRNIRLTVYTDNAAKNQSETYYLSGPSAIKIVPDKRFYQVGETAHVTILADPQDDNIGVAGMVLAGVLTNGVSILQKELSLQNSKTQFSFVVGEDMLPTMEIAASKLSAMSYDDYWSYNRYYYDSMTRQYVKDESTGDRFSDRYSVAEDRVAAGVGIASQLNLTVTPGKTTLKPGEEVQILLSTFNGSSPVSAALAIGIVDEALLSMGGESSFDEIRADLQQDPGYEQYSVYNYVWGMDVVMVKRAAPMFFSTGFFDYRPESGYVSYSSLNKIGDKVSNSPSSASVSQLSLAMASFGVLGYFGILGLGIKYKKTFVALLASIVLLAGLAPAALFIGNQTSVVKYADTGQPLTFTQGTSSSQQGYGYQEGMRGGNIDFLNPPKATGGDAENSDGGGGASQSLGPGGVVAPTRSVTVRTYFPELWYWNPIVVTDESGKAVISLKAPDSITTWRIDALASTIDGRIGVGNGSMVVFQPFFVDPDLPVSVVRNDLFTFKVAIYNYEDVPRQVSVALSSAPWFQTVGPATASAQLNANSVSSVSFTIRALRVGVQDLMVTGTTDTRQDTVVRQLAVEPDGRLVEDIRNGLLVNTSVAELLFALDANRIAGSENAYLKLQSSLESIIIDGAEGFIHVVSGCGEQSTSSLSVDILAYQNYLKGRTDPENLTYYQDILNKGIQHEAQYLSSNTGGHGRAIVWHTGEQPDIWLTAWAIQAYKNLREAGFTVDERIIPDLQTYLLSAKQADGSWKFPDVGHWSLNSELESYQLAATAYIVRALLVSGVSPSNAGIQPGITYIEKNAGSAKSDFTRALCLEALELAGGSSSVRGSLVSQLVANAKDGGNGALYWSYAEKTGPEYYYRSDNTIETTGYAIMALARAGASVAIVQGGAKYLVLQRGGGGYYGSTHNTAVAFTALNSLAEITPLKDISVDVLVNGVVVDAVRITQENKDMTFLTDLRSWFVSQEGQTAAKTVSVMLRSSGEGGVFYHLYTKQNIDWVKTQPAAPAALGFSVSYSTTNVSVGDVISASAAVTYAGKAPAVQMVLVDIRAPTGFVLAEGDFMDMLAGGDISFYEFLGGGRALVYLDNLARGETTNITYTLTAMSASTALLQHVNAFDMYNTSLRAELAPVGFVSS
jgi:uncharacterized protein YfaS (alpha-2-macroglobulin family)